MQHFETQKQISAEEYCERLGEWLDAAKKYADERPISIEGMSASHDEAQEWFDWYVTYYKVDMWLSFDKPYYVVGDTVNWALSIGNQTARPIKDAKLTQTAQTTGYPKMIQDQTVNIAQNGSQRLTGSFAATTALIGSFSAAAGLTFYDHNAFTSNVATSRIEAVNHAYDIAITVTSKPTIGNAYVIGEDVTYQVTITNTGNVPLSNVTLSNSLSGATMPNGSTIASIGVGETVTALVSYTVKDSDAGKTLTNTVTATANGVTHSATATSVTVHTYKLTVTVTISNNGTGIDNAYTTGDNINYTITVRNDSEIALSNVDVTSSLSSLG